MLIVPALEKWRQEGSSIQCHLRSHIEFGDSLGYMRSHVNKVRIPETEKRERWRKGGREKGEWREGGREDIK